MRARKSLPGFIAAVALVAGAPTAWASPDLSGSSNLVEPNGFPGICNQPCFTATKSFEVFLSGNPDAPAGAGCTAGNNTYIYKITHTGGSGPFVPGLTKFELAVETDDVSSAGFISGFGLDPSAVTVNPTLDTVSWDFNPPIADGGMSTKLFVCSPLLPGDATDSMVSLDGQLNLDAPGTCVGPVVAPAGEPAPCTIGFWKNRAAGKKGLLKFFPDGDFDAVVSAAVALSGGIFANEADLLADLQSKGNRPMETRARQQLAAFLLNLAAGDLYPDNEKCRLFEGNSIDANSCGSSISVGTALSGIFADFGSGDFEGAKDCADDTNNGIGVVGTE